MLHVDIPTLAEFKALAAKSDACVSLYLLTSSKDSVRLVHVFANLAPVEIKVPELPHTAEDATRRPCVHVRAPRGHLQNLESEKVLLQKYARQVDRAVCSALVGQGTPLV